MLDPSRFRRSGSTLTLKVNGSTAATGTSSGSVTDQHLAVAADHSDVVWPDTVEEWEMWKGRLARRALRRGAQRRQDLGPCRRWLHPVRGVRIRHRMAVRVAWAPTQVLDRLKGVTHGCW